MKKKLLFWSFGNFDLYFDNTLIETSKDPLFQGKNFVERVAFLTENFDEYQDKISFVALEAFLEQIGQEGITYDMIGVFTKQENQYNITDTYPMLALLKKYLKVKNESRKRKINFQDYENQIILNHIYNEQRIRDVLYISLLRFQNEALFDEYQEILRNITGGTKIVTLILLKVIKELFGDDLINLCYALWDKNENKSIFKTLDSKLVL